MMREISNLRDNLKLVILPNTDEYKLFFQEFEKVYDQKERHESRLSMIYLKWVVNKKASMIKSIDMENDHLSKTPKE
jgi:hypothetical protein